MKLIMENWRDFRKKLKPMPKLSSPEEMPNPDPDYPDMVKGRKSRRIDADPQDVISALQALQKDKDIFKKSDRPLNLPTLTLGKDVRKQLGLFVNDVEDSINNKGVTPEAKKEIENKIAYIKNIIKSRDEIETADTIHSAAPDTGDNTASAWYDALDLKEAIGHVERILELIQDGKN